MLNTYPYSSVMWNTYPYSSVDEPSSPVVRPEVRVFLSSSDCDIPYLWWREAARVSGWGRSQ